MNVSIKLPRYSCQRRDNKQRRKMDLVCIPLPRDQYQEEYIWTTIVKGKYYQISVREEESPP